MGAQLSLYESNAPALSIRPLWTRQEAAMEEARQAIREGHRRIVVHGPCGFGKTLWAAHVIYYARQKFKRCLFTCPGITLVDQTYKAFVAEGIRDIGIIQSDHVLTDSSMPIQVACVPSLVRRQVERPDICIIDEAHEQYEGLNELLDSEAWRNVVVIALSATPWTRGMGLRYTKLIVAGTSNELIAEGKLCPAVVYEPEHKIDRRKLKMKTVAGGQREFTDKSASDAMRDPVVVGDIVQTWMERGTAGKTFLFAVNRAHAQEQMAAFQDNGIPFGYIDANTDRDERTRIFAQLRYGEIAGIASVRCLIRGVDEDIRTLIDGQPTNDEKSHVQKWGRGIRNADGKTHLVGLDHAGNNRWLGMFHDIHYDSLDTRKPGERKEETDEGAYDSTPKPRVCSRCHALIPAGRRSCPGCGAESKVGPSGVKTREGNLVLMQTKAHEERQTWYSQLLGLGAERGYERGWAAHAFKDKFGEWPDGLRKREAKPSRKVRQFDRQRRHENWKAWKAQQEQGEIKMEPVTLKPEAEWPAP